MRLFAVVLFMTAGFISKAQPAADIIEYIHAYKQMAIEEMQRTGVPASIKLAQGIHETSAGKSVLVLKSNNHFGIKCKAYWTGKKVYHDDDARGECFRSYQFPADSYKDHSDFLKNSERYATLFQLDPTDYKAWATGLRKAGYATNPKYAPIIIKLIEDYNLQQYTLIAMGKLQPADEIIAQSPQPASRIPAIEMPEEVKPEDPSKEIPVIDTSYPSGEFLIENTRVMFGKQGTSLLAIAQQYDIPLSRLLQFNDLDGEEILTKDRLVYLQKKRRYAKSKL